MAKNFPFFKFVVSEWMTGDIVFEPFNVQGLFINICALYWQRDGCLTIEDIKKRYKNPTELAELSDRFIVVTDGFISIKFLDEQLIDAGHISKVNSLNGKKGAEAKANAKRLLSERSANLSKEEQEEEQEEEEEEEKEDIFNFKNSMLKYGFKENLISEWLKVRKNKKATNTETAFSKFITQIELTKQDKNLILETCIEKSWSGFNSEWMKNESNFNKQQRVISNHDDGIL
jgi:hypothetical protein